MSWKIREIVTINTIEKPEPDKLIIGHWLSGHKFIMCLKKTGIVEASNLRNEYGIEKPILHPNWEYVSPLIKCWQYFPEHKEE